MEIGQFVFSGIPRVTFGSGSFSGLNKIVRSYGRNVLIVTGGNSLKKTGKLDTLIADLEKDKIKVSLYSVSGEPSPAMIDHAAAEFRKKPINAVVSIGGGSVLDAGKAIAAMLGEEGSVEDYLEGVGTKKLSGVKAPFIAVPTTAGTGSEATKNAVLSIVGEQGYKKSLRHDNYVPDAVLIDPELMLSCPKAITASCGMDALSQLLESYISVKANPMTDALALSGIKAFSESFLIAIEHGDHDIIAREKMAYASFISGITLAQAGLGTVHGIAGPMGGFFPVPHGTACGTLLAPVLRILADKLISMNHPAVKKLAEAAKIITGIQNGDDSILCAALCDAVDSLTEKAGIPHLCSFGIQESDLAKIAVASDNKSSPAELSQSEMIEVMKGILN